MYRKYMSNAFFKLSTPLMPPRVVNSRDSMCVLIAKNPDNSKCDLYDVNGKIKYTTLRH